jgi:hypothetical protein
VRVLGTLCIPLTDGRILDSIQDDKTPLPPVAATPEEDEDLFGEQVWCDAPIKMDYGHNVKSVIPETMCCRKLLTRQIR